MPKQIKIVIAVIISSYGFLGLLPVCQFGRCLSAFSHSALRSIFLVGLALSCLIICAGAPAAHLDNTADFYKLTISVFRKSRLFQHIAGANISYSEVSVLDLRFGVSYHGQSAKPDGNATGRYLAKVLGLTATVLPEVTQLQPNLFSHCK